MSVPPRLAILAATSGHSGVDRNLQHLVPAIAARGVRVDLLHIRNHGPHLDPLPAGVRSVELGAAHVNTSLPAVIRYLRREQPDALLSDKDRVNRLALWARRLSGAPTRVAVRLGIHVSENLATRGPLERLVQRTSIRRFYPWADAIIVPSRGVADDLAALGRLPRDRIQVLPNPVVTPELLARAQEPADHSWLAAGEPPLVLGVGELSARKDFATLVRAFARVRGQRPCRLLILGRGRQHDALLTLAAELGVAQDVALPGFVANPFAFMHRAAVFVLSSRVEGFGNVLVEALAAGAPAVATDCPSGPAEILAGGRYGALVPVGDAEAMAAAIDATIRQPLAAELRREAVQRFTVEASARAYLRALALPAAT
jgi:glycosyltransferase involved in cell wall biosynthesis